MWDFQEIDRQRDLPNSWSHIAREKYNNTYKRYVHHSAKDSVLNVMKIRVGLVHFQLPFSVLFSVSYVVTS